MIQSFANEVTENIWEGTPVRGLDPGLQRRAKRKLEEVESAGAIYDFYNPPSNDFKALHGEWEGWYQIRVDRRYRIRFQFTDGNASSVWFGEFHGS